MRNLSAEQGLTGASQNSPGTVARHTYLGGSPKQSDESIGQGIAQWLDFNSEMVKCYKGEGLWKPDAEHLMAESELASQQRVDWFSWGMTL